MLAIILLIAATSAIASYARGRGGNPWLWGGLAVFGYFLVPLMVTNVTVSQEWVRPDSDDVKLLSFTSAILWVAALAFCARFLVGRKHDSPGTMWSCPNCKYLNQSYAVVCEACRQPYRRKS